MEADVQDCHRSGGTGAKEKRKREVSLHKANVGNCFISVLHGDTTRITRQGSLCRYCCTPYTGGVFSGETFCGEDYNEAVFVLQGLETESCPKFLGAEKRDPGPPENDHSQLGTIYRGSSYPTVSSRCQSTISRTIGDHHSTHDPPPDCGSVAPQRILFTSCRRRAFSRVLPPSNRGYRCRPRRHNHVFCAHLDKK